MKIRERITDWYLTRKTGKTKAERDWEEWYNENVIYRADSIKHMFRHFKYVIEVDFNKFITDDGLAWVPVEDARKYFWPQRELATTCVWRIEQVRKGQWGEWQIDNCWGADKIFVATNSPEDAMMITLLYA